MYRFIKNHINHEITVTYLKVGIIPPRASKYNKNLIIEHL
ncbi:hypothetical protein VFMJ11_A0746 [Aliivibrio fischeri MJ11]|uniref:Uncharacterized protein n=1 Tax=Aliivibrio fischeri (strain MJ11) TaxID=388396 RepID=B5EUC7_ALIFM|nr:hypothetical protein VFMJ11_A0746 [Aliivibrio fischeri MJ11]